MYTGEYTPWRPYAMFDKRDGGDVSDTFSSWHGCMQKNYCKWPVIAAIIVGSLLLLSVFCDKPKRDKSYIKYNDSDPIVATQPAPVAAPVYYPPVPPVPPVPKPEPHIPQVATFDSPRVPPPVPKEAGGGNFNPDSLPHMPAWSEAKTKYVEEPAADNVEMETLPPTYPPSRHASPVAQSRSSPLQSPAVVQPLLSQSPVQRTPSPHYGYHDGYRDVPQINLPPQQHAQQLSPAWNSDPYYGSQGHSNYMGTPVRIPSPSHQHYTQPNTAPYPHSEAGDDAYGFSMPTHEYNPHPQESYGHQPENYGYDADAWRHSPVQQQHQQQQLQQQQQQQQQQQAFDFAYGHNDHGMGQSTYGETENVSAATSHSNVPSMLAPGPRSSPHHMQRQSAELGF
ncbi:hypothetical protein AAP_03810 [Ascosphaera apis ARSEF 7405]|uniref:Uncharacterized protein n=1 Tax=Ascosphaera apis ARSEF 7405 TaxID=392613 RepID=A0A167Y0R4_9EURO|nr:hypothetical protein AAP_03810 [Ascosphaera apis ARSEF 7405]